MLFTEELKQAAQPYLSANKAHPFIQSVLKNQVNPEVLSYYIQQDLQYANAETTVQTTLVANSKNYSDQHLFANQLSTHLNSVSALFKQLTTNISGQWEHQQDAQIEPVTFLYRQHILSPIPSANLLAILAPFEAGIWMYVELGKYLDESGQITADNPFATWVDDIQHGEFSGENGISNQFLAIIDREAELATANERLAAKQAFLRSCLFEWYFWDAAYKQITWRDWVNGAFNGKGGDLL